MFMGFTLDFYIIFGTNLLTGGPSRIAIFFAYFSVWQKRNIKRSPNAMKPSGAIFLEQMQTRGLGVDGTQQARRSQGCPARPLPRGLLVGCLTPTPSPLDHICSKNHAPEGFIPFGLPYIFLFFETLKYAKIPAIWARPPVSRLVPKII